MKEGTKQELIQELKQYLKENIEDFELRAEVAYNQMARWRAPLSYAASSLDEEITEKVQEWLYDNIDNEDLI